MNHLDHILQERGILEAARAMHWRTDGNGWEYPLWNFDGDCLKPRRWKNADSSARTKYFWRDDDTSARYYHAPDIRQAVQAAGGVLYIANGEPSVLAYHAAGLRNVLSWFGEVSVPPTLPADLRALGVIRVVYAPDNDDPGRSSAVKVRDMRAGSGIDFEAVSLEAYPAKSDFNDVWKLCEFDADRARNTLGSLPALELPPPEASPVERPQHRTSSGAGRVDRARLLEDVLAYFQQLPRWKRSGKGFAGPSPFREDKHSSAGITVQTGTYTDFATGEKLRLFEVAELAGFRLDDYRDQPPRPAGQSSRCRENLERSKSPENVTFQVRSPRGGKAEKTPFQVRYSRKNYAETGQNPAQSGISPVTHVGDKKHPAISENSLLMEFPESLKKEACQLEVAPKLLPPAWVKLEPFTPHIREAAPYVNDLPYIRRLLAGADLPDVLVFKSGLGTGKTQFVVDLLKARAFGRVLYVTHSETLTVNANERLKTTGRDFVRYGDLPPDIPLYLADSVVCSADSIHRLAGGQPYDVVICDELVQLLPQFTSKTMNDTYTPNWQTCRTILKNARHVIAMDAQQNDLAAHWLEELTGRDALKVENTHASPNTLTLHTDSYHLLAALTEAVDANQGTVIFTTSSRSEARRIFRQFARRYPGKVRAIHGWNSQESGSRQLVQNINEELPKLRLFIASPSVATGVDVTAPVYAVFGAFGSPTAPNNWIQQLRRYRQAAQYHAVIRAGNSETLITDPAVLLSMERGKVLATRDLARFNDYNVPVVTMAQADITRLWADFTAAANRQKMQPEAYFVALAQHEGFTVYEDDRAAPAAARATFKANRDALKAEDDNRVLTLPPVSDADLDKRRRAGTVGEADMLANQRWKIEDTTGGMITPEMLDRYRTPAHRAALRRFTDYTLPVKVAQGKDRTEAALLPFKRSHHTLHRTILDDVLQAVWGSVGLESKEEIPAPELEKRLKLVMDKHQRSIQQLDRRSDLSEEAIPVLRRVLAWFGLTISSKQARTENGRVMVYWIDRDNLAYIQAAAEQRRAYLETQQHEKDVSKITERDSYKRDFRQPPPVLPAIPPPAMPPPRLSLFPGGGSIINHPLKPFGGVRQ